MNLFNESATLKQKYDKVMNLFNESATLKQKYDKANNSRFKNETILKPRLHVNKIVYK